MSAHLAPSSEMEFESGRKFPIEKGSGLVGAGVRSMAVEAKGVLVRRQFLRSQNCEANCVLVRRGSRGRAGLKSGTRPPLVLASQRDESQASFVIFRYNVTRN